MFDNVFGFLLFHQKETDESLMFYVLQALGSTMGMVRLNNL